MVIPFVDQLVGKGKGADEKEAKEVIFLKDLRS